MHQQPRRRTVSRRLPLEDRGCLYCLGTDGPFLSEEHVLPRSLGPETDRFVLPPGVVCDPCNTWLGRQVDAPFVARFDMRITRGIEGLSARSGGAPVVIDGRDATTLLTIRVDRREVALYASKADQTTDGGLDIEIKPIVRDPADITARTIRALWKIALGCLWMDRGRSALDPAWDDLRRCVLGAPFRGVLLQAPFVVRSSRALTIDLKPATPSRLDAFLFVMGGVGFAVPLAPGRFARPTEGVVEGWDVVTTGAAAANVVRLRLDPS